MTLLSPWFRALVLAMMMTLCVSHATMSEAVSHHSQAQTIGDRLSDEFQDELHSAHYDDVGDPGDAPVVHLHLHADNVSVAPALAAPVATPAAAPVMGPAVVLTSHATPPLVEPPAA
ncbi:hypothetical protein [Glacieibacterium sp.]|uniref:hypothetical protein n=1 Tax=Glacieibacterium sp. TaxID=2860237 RepID=UPI003AFFEBC7